MLMKPLANRINQCIADNLAKACLAPDRSILYLRGSGAPITLFKGMPWVNGYPLGNSASLSPIPNSLPKP